MARPLCTPKYVAIDESTRASSIAIMPSSRQPPPGQPYPEYATPAMPSWRRPGTRSCGNSSLVQ